MQYAEIQRKVIAIVSEMIGTPADEITCDTTLQDDLGYDSLDGVETIMEIEEEFDIEIPDGDVNENLTWTVGMVVDYVNKRLNAPRSPTL